MYPKLDTSHSCRLAHLDKGRAVSGANRVYAYGCSSGVVQGSTVGTEVTIDKFGIVLFRIQLLEGLGLQLIASRFCFQWHDKMCR